MLVVLRVNHLIPPSPWGDCRCSLFVFRNISTTFSFSLGAEKGEKEVIAELDSANPQCSSFSAPKNLKYHSRIFNVCYKIIDKRKSNNEQRITLT